MNAVKTAQQHLQQLKFELRSLVAREPALSPFYWLVVWWTQYKAPPHVDKRECRVGPETEFVLDGFQGSANTFATVAFKYSQREPVMIAHHLHAPAQIIKAVRMGLPTLVTIRCPEDTALSLVSRWPYVTVPQALRNYARFYEKIEPYAPGFVLSPFDQTTGYLDRVIQEVNRRFDCDFDLFTHTEENVRAVRNPSPSKSKEEAQREVLKAEKARVLQREELQPLLRRAETVYQRLLHLGVSH